jgi:hypothetical protein
MTSSPNILSSNVGFSALQVQALKNSFVQATGTDTINTLNVGASGTAGTINIFPATASKGKAVVTVSDNTTNTTTAITVAAQAAARTYTVPDAGTTNASFVMTQGTQTLAGATTFTTAVTPTGGVGAAGGFSAAPRALHSQGQKAVVSTDGTDTTPSTTETYITSMFVPCNMTIVGVNVFNGSNVTGNITVGLANAVDGTPIAAAKSASTAGSGTDAYQKIPFATPYAAVGPANYLVCVQYDSATARFNTHAIGTDPNLKQTGTTYGTIPTISPLPTTFVTNLSNIMSFY